MNSNTQNKAQYFSERIKLTRIDAPDMPGSETSNYTFTQLVESSKGLEKMLTDTMIESPERGTRAPTDILEAMSREIESTYGEILGLIRGVESMHKLLDARMDQLVVRANSAKDAALELIKQNEREERAREKLEG